MYASVLVPPVIAFVIVLVAMWLSAGIARAVRTHDYRLFKDANKEAFVQSIPIPSFDRSPSDERLEALSVFVDAMHEKANAIQTRYHNAVAGSAGCLAVAFFALTLGTLAQEGGPLAKHHEIEHTLIWIDVFAILFVLILFQRGQDANRGWIVARAGVELVRQYQFLDLVFPGADRKRALDDRRAGIQLEAESVNERVQDGPVSKIIERIERFWRERKASLESLPADELDMPADAPLVHLRRRARRQLIWFADSKARLEHIDERRGKVLLGLYYVSGVLAAAKLITFLVIGHPLPYLLQALLIVTGVSGAMTAYYINQNARSLIHRYNSQQRQITHWLEDFGKRWRFDDLPSRELNDADKSEMRARFLEFEDLMVEELIDWIHITSHDAIELAP